MSRPRILTTLDEGSTLRRGVAFPTVVCKTAYASAIYAAGGLPLFVAPSSAPDAIEAMLGVMDGLVVTGGAFDIPPELYGAATPAGVRVDPPKPGRTRMEWQLVEAALARGRPVLGICGGMQLLNVVLGGTLLLDIGAELPGALEHEQEHSPAEPAHPVLLEGALAARLGRREIHVNTTHHQAVARLAPSLVVTGRAPDGVIEAIEHASAPAVRGVQWHPELLDDEVSRALYGDLVSASR